MIICRAAPLAPDVRPPSCDGPALLSHRVVCLPQYLVVKSFDLHVSTLDWIKTRADIELHFWFRSQAISLCSYDHNARHDSGRSSTANNSRQLASPTFIGHLCNVRAASVSRAGDMALRQACGHKQCGYKRSDASVDFYCSRPVAKGVTRSNHCTRLPAETVCVCHSAAKLR